jgi:hypothetical protein
VGAEGLAELFSFCANPTDQLVEFLAIALSRFELIGKPFHSVQSYGDLVGVRRQRHVPVSNSTSYLSLATIDELAELPEGRVAVDFGAGSQSRSLRDGRP